MKRPRLKDWEVKIIKETAKKVFGEGTKVYLFGSRVYPEKKGGDIDLYVIPANREKVFQKKRKFLIELWRTLGEQKIDVVLAKHKIRTIDKIALKEGVEL